MGSGRVGAAAVIRETGHPPWTHGCRGSDDTAAAEEEGDVRTPRGVEGGDVMTRARGDEEMT